MSSNSSHQGRIVKKQIRTSAAPSLAFRAWAEPDKLAHFFVESAEGNIEPGGTYIWGWDTFGVKAPCTVVEVEQDKRLVLSAEVPGDPFPRIFEITIEQDAGETVTAATDALMTRLT